MEIVFIKAEETLPLRSKLLRNGWPLEVCRFPSDPIAFHLAQKTDDGQIACILSCHKQPKEPLEGVVYQLRGMATEPVFQGSGLGRQLVDFCVAHLKTLGADVLWCNARRNAYTFYQGRGFEFMSEEFDIPDAGPHRVMYKKLS